MIDLLHITDNRVDIFDYKTDPDRLAHEKYRKQLSAYYHVLASVYPDRSIHFVVFDTRDNERVLVDPLSAVQHGESALARTGN